MVEYCAVLILDNEQIVTDYYYRDYKSELKRRVMGLEGTYDVMPITTLNHIVKNSNKIYLYNGTKEIEQYKLGIQKFLDIDNGLDKVIVMETNIRAKLNGTTYKDNNKKFIGKIFDGSEFDIPEEKIIKADILKYILAGFSRVYTNINNGTHKKIREVAIRNYHDTNKRLLAKYTGYKELNASGYSNIPFKNYLYRLSKQYKEDDSDIEIIKETIYDRGELVNWERTSEGLEKTMLFNINGSLIHGYMSKYNNDEYEKVLRENYNFIRLEGWGHQFEIQNGRKSGIKEEGKSNLKIYREYMVMYKNVANKNYRQTEDGKDLYTVNLLDLVKSCYDNDIFIYDANIHYIELIFKKDRDIEEVKETVSNILSKTEFKDKLTIKIKEEQLC